jgi:hypothetical protein
MTKDEWIARRQENSEFTWDEILASGYDAMPCSCQLKGCLGWKLLKVQNSFIPVKKKVSLVSQTPPEAA